MKNTNNYVVIMAGGIGSRFWPMSRTNYPKQFLDILGTGKTLLQSTYDRFLSFIPNENIFIVTADEYVSIVSHQLPELPPQNIVGEPFRKNTAACINLITIKIIKLNPSANLIVAPSDHLIENNEAFVRNCLEGLEYTNHQNAFVTLGIQPTYAHTGYGYIQYQKESGTTIYPVKRFTEKPTKEKATEFLEDGSYVWNSGIFIWKAADILQAFRTYMPFMFDLFVSRWLDYNSPHEAGAIRQIYSDCESISIDYAILEKAKNVYVIPAGFNWSDLGSWNSAYEIFEKDYSQNAIAGKNTLMVDSKGCMIHSSDQKLVLVGGVDDLIVVNTKDALLICKKENEQQIKDYLSKVKETMGELYL